MELLFCRAQVCLFMFSDLHTYGKLKKKVTSKGMEGGFPVYAKAGEGREKALTHGRKLLDCRGSKHKAVCVFVCGLKMKLCVLCKHAVGRLLKCFQNYR